MLSPIEAVAEDPGDLVALATDFGEPEPLDLHVVYPSRRLLPQRVRMAIDWLCDRRHAPNPELAAKSLARRAR